MRGRSAPGTHARQTLDVGRMAESLSRPGIDPRSWVERGTVATFAGDDGVPNYTDGNAIFIDENGVDVDVVIGTDDHPTSCRWGLSYGDACIIPPIRPGDQVLVLIPGGDLGNVPEIVKVLAGPYDKLPLDPSDRKPRFRNDRLLLYTRNVPIDLRTAGGARVLANQDGTVVVNEGTKGAARVGDTTKLTLTSIDIAHLAASMIAAGMVLPGTPTGVADPVVCTNGEVTSGSATVKLGD